MVLDVQISYSRAGKGGMGTARLDSSVQRRGSETGRRLGTARVPGRRRKKLVKTSSDLGLGFSLARLVWLGHKYIGTILSTMGRETRKSLETSSPASLVYIVGKQGALTQTRWKLRTDTRGCPLTSTCVPRHTYSCTYTWTHWCTCKH